MQNPVGAISAPLLSGIWIALSQSCDHFCKNCFQTTKKGIDRNPKNLKPEEILDMAAQAVELGAVKIGIPGAGEPFHPANVRTLFCLLDANARMGIHTTIFTHLGFVDGKMIERLSGYGTGITLLVKCNTFDAGRQDWFDEVSGYGERRNGTLRRLIERGFGDGKRLGLVTSIMTFNYEEIPEIFRFCRQHNLLVDMDAILPVGRGRGSIFAVSPEKLKAMYEQLSEMDAREFGRHWEPSLTYVGENICNRIGSFLYITKTGEAHPCVGAMDVHLGNVREKRLAEMMKSREMGILRARKYDGECMDCSKFIRKKCYSCLGRSTRNLNNKDLLRTGKVHTMGCCFKTK